MRKLFFFCIFTLLWIITCNMASTDNLWKDVEKAKSDGLPKTAIKHLEEIIRTAELENLENEWLKAVTEKIILESIIQGNKPLEKVILIKEEISKAKKPLDTLLKVILARWYWHYYTQNRWRFMNRTRTDGHQSDDIETWDLPKLYMDIDNLYTDILKDSEYLLKIPAERFKGFFSLGNMPSALRPTLYDFAAWEAISFYSCPEFNTAMPADSWEIDCQSDAFEQYRIFIKYEPDTADIESPRYKAFRLFQNLLRQHIKTGNIPALIDTDINRLIYIKNNCYGENLNKIFITRLNEIIDKYHKYKETSTAFHRMAMAWQTEGDLNIAHEYAERCTLEYAGTIAASNCLALINDIETKSLSIKNETSIPEGNGKISLSYRNIERLYFRIIEGDRDEFLSEGYYGSSYFPENRIQRLLEKKPLYSWEQELKKTGDYKTAVIEADLPMLSMGFYYIIAGSSADFASTSQLQASSFWVSNLSLITRTEENTLDGFVLDASGGFPVEDAEISIYIHAGNKPPALMETVRTDKDGYYITRSLKPYESYYLLVKKNRDMILNTNHIQVSRPSEASPFKKTVIFTDRAIYRPGQTIHYKGICADIDQKGNYYRTIPGQKVEVVFSDQNRKEIGSQTLTANDFGSFSGTFTAPSDRLLGVMRISASYPSGETSIRVEEYKRPRFFVDFDDIEQAYRINEQIIATGKALAYNGSPVNDAEVRYRVVREANYPSWWSYFFPRASSPAQEIKNGTTRTDSLGSFSIEFDARPDLKTLDNTDIYYRYTVYADITDTAGETRSSSKSVFAGSRSTFMNISAGNEPDETKPLELSVSSSTINGKPCPASGYIRIYKLAEPEKPIPKSLWDTPRETGAFGDEWRKWPAEKEVASIAFDTGSKNPFPVNIRLDAGLYRAEATAKDTRGEPIKAIQSIMVSPSAEKTRFPINIPFYARPLSYSSRPGDVFEMLWGTGYDEGRAFVEIVSDTGVLQSFWTNEGSTQQIIKQNVTEDMRGGFIVTVFYVRENRNYTTNYYISVPWDNKNISMHFESFRDTLLPGEPEIWRIKLSAEKAGLDAAEMVGTLYDSSLDAFISHGFPSLNFFKTIGRRRYYGFSDTVKNFAVVRNTWNRFYQQVEYSYIGLPQHIVNQFHYYEMMYDIRQKTGAPLPPTAMDGKDGGIAESQPVPANELMSRNGSGSPGKTAEKDASRDQTRDPDSDIKNIKIRTDLSETAFFYPHLLMDADGSVIIEFKAGESLTKWKFLGFAHNNELMSGSISSYVTTRKDIMIQPNPPRFLRENDRIEFTATVINATDRAQEVRASLILMDYINYNDMASLIDNHDSTHKISLEPGISKAISWSLKVPEGCNPLEFTVSAVTENQSDGEKGVIPVLSSKIFVTESIPLHIRGKCQKDFRFDSIGMAIKSQDTRPYRLTVEISSNPLWYAVQALPYLIEYPYECSEQIFNRIYANYISGYILKSDPKIKRIMDNWNRSPESPKSKLEANQELKSVMLEETPWLISARNESENMKNLSLFFDENHISSFHQRSIKKLKDMQNSDGGFSWFPGGRSDIFITMYLAGGFGRLERLGMDEDHNITARAISFMDSWLLKTYLELKDREANNLSPLIAQYLYSRSYWSKKYPVSADCKEAFGYYYEQAASNWLSLNSRMNQAQAALALHRLGDENTPKNIMASIRERSVSDEELGMFWREDELSLWWYRAPIETQALVIEAFDEIMKDPGVVEDCKVWLLKQKQATSWKTTKATADAVHALISTGDNWLADSELTRAELGGMDFTPDTAEAGTGYYKIILQENDIKEEYSDIRLIKDEQGISWGGVHFQYFKDISEITGHKTSIMVEKQLFAESYTDKGITISPVSKALKVGDTLVSRITVKTDRDMEYVHLRDYRGSGLEPADVLSGYRYQDGLYYYQTTRDTATHFFIDYLPKGTYVFEYRLKVRHRGVYQAGTAEIMCMYAPEFNSHSGSITLSVK